VEEACVMNCLKSLSGRACLKVLGFREAALSLKALQELVCMAHERCCSFATISEVLHGELPTDRVCLLVTFDGALTEFRSPVQWLVDHGVPCLIHASTRQVVVGEGMSVNDITALARHPLINFGNYTHSQRSLVDLSEEEVSQEISQCQLMLGEWTGSVPATLAYPNGRHDERVRRMAASLGIKAAFTDQRADVSVPLKLKDGSEMQIGRWMEPLNA